jgi:2OG-Fe(II) oxygenase superfamily
MGQHLTAEIDVDTELPRIIDDFLPEATAETLFGYINNIQWAYGKRSNVSIEQSHWAHEIARGDRLNGLDVSQWLRGPVVDAWKFIQSNYLPDHVLIRCYANAHTYGVEGYPHTDSNRDQDITVVIYMNKNWKREWGGETLVYDKDKIILGAIPVFNRAVIFKANQWHCAKGVSRICTDLRRTIMFKCAKVGADTKRDELQIFLSKLGTVFKDHVNGNLSAHLLGTYDLLKAAGQDETICLAGGTHSIFGTNVFKDQTLTYEQRGELVSAFGDTTAELAHLFGTINRPQVLETALGQGLTSLELTNGGTVEVSEYQLNALCLVEAANLKEQNSLKKYTNLQKLWDSVKNHS